MLFPRNRHASGRVRVCVLLAVLGLLVGFLFWHPPPFLSDLFDRERFEADPNRLEKLREATLTPDAIATDTHDWPQWRGPRRDGISNNTGFRTDWGDEVPRVLWRAKTGAGFASVAVVAGRVYSLVQDGGEEAVVCWDAESGTEKWRERYSANFGKGYPGPRATPTIAAGRVYTVGATGLFHCLDADTGKVRWKIDMQKELGAIQPEWGFACSPLVDGELVFVIAGGPQNGVAAFECESGKKLWGALDDIAGYSSPILATLAGKRQLVCFTGKAVVGLSPDDGALHWRYPWSTKFDVNAATPIVAGNYVFISSNYGRGCALLEIVASSDGRMTAERVYENNRMRNHFSTCVLFHDHLYGFDDSMLVCMDFRTGDIRWKERGFGKGALLLAGEHLVVQGDRGKLAMAPASPERFRPILSYQALSANARDCWAMPVLVDNRLYLRDAEELLCLDVRWQLR